MKWRYPHLVQSVMRQRSKVKSRKSVADQRPSSLLPLFLLLLTFTLLVLMHTLATPIFEAPDEVWHYAYVRWLAEGHGLPAMDNNDSGANQEVAQPPLYYWVAALFSAPFADADLDTLLWGNPNFGYQGPLTSADNKNMLIHTARERFPWRGAVLAIHITRLTSLGFGLLTVIAAWGLGYETFNTRRGALVTAALVAFHPQFIFISSVVSNDSAAAALCTTTLWSIAYGFRRGLTTRRVIVTGILAGLCTLTKTSAMLMVGVAGGAVIVQSFKFQVSSFKFQVSSFKSRSKKQEARNLHPAPCILHPASCILLLASCILLVGGWWYARNWVQYGDPLGMASHTGTLWGRAVPVSLWALLPEVPLLLKSFWAAYGWGHVMWADWVYVGLWGINGWLLARGLGGMTNGDGSAAAEWQISKLAHYVSRLTPQTLTLCFATAWFGGIFAALLHWMRQVAAPHGRLLFPAIGAWAVLVAAGGMRKSQVASRKSEIRGLLKMLLGGMVMLATLAPALRIWRALGPPRLRSPEVVLREVTPVNYTYQDQARLLGIETDGVLDGTGTRLAPGDSLHIRACWEAVQPMSRDYTVFVHLIGPGNSRVAERHTYPGLGRFPTSQWPVGRAFCDTYRLTIEPWATGPIKYQLELGLFDAETGTKLNAQNMHGDRLTLPIVGSVVVAPQVPTLPVPQTNASVKMGTLAQLRGYDVPAAATSGSDVTLSLYWEALQSPNSDSSANDTPLMTFVHLWQPGAPQALAQSDSVPGQGWAPTSIWQTGDFIHDTHILHLPADLPPGNYPLWAGMYEADTGARLPALGSAGLYEHNLIPLGTISIVEE